MSGSSTADTKDSLKKEIDSSFKVILFRGRCGVGVEDGGWGGEKGEEGWKGKV